MHASENKRYGYPGRGDECNTRVTLERRRRASRRSEDELDENSSLDPVEVAVALLFGAQRNLQWARRSSSSRGSTWRSFMSTVKHQTSVGTKYMSVEISPGLTRIGGRTKHIRGCGVVGGGRLARMFSAPRLRTRDDHPERRLNLSPVDCLLRVHVNVLLLTVIVSSGTSASVLSTLYTTCADRYNKLPVTQLLPNQLLGCTDLPSFDMKTCTPKYLQQMSVRSHRVLCHADKCRRTSG